MKKPICWITMGDPAGIGPEIIIKALSFNNLYQDCRPLVIGDSRILKDRLSIIPCSLEIKSIKELTEAQFTPGVVEILDLNNADPCGLKIGQVSKQAGQAAVEYIKEGVRLVLSRKIDTLVTAPISKEAINQAGFNYEGHTELLAELTHTQNYVMFFASPSLKVALVTTHIPLKEVPLSLSPERILEVIKLSYQALTCFWAMTEPKIGVAGLNPHAGEAGIFGQEEEMIKEAIKNAQRSGIDVQGPYPADTLFTKENLTHYDCFVAMYHDQGLIPVKLLDFEKAVNVTIGLPFIRTSPDHGTAFDIAGRGIANPSSMIEAIKLAAQMARKTAPG